MWVKQAKINKHLFINDDNFEFIHFVEDCYRQDDTSESNLILFENDKFWYIAELSEDISDLGFNNDIIDNAGYIYNDGSGWYLTKEFSYYSDTESRVWKFLKDGNGDIVGNNKVIGNKFKLNESTMEFEPFPVASGSEDVSSYNIPLDRYGLGVYKSASKLGTYEWQGDGSNDDIIVGHRKYKHKALDSDGNQTSVDVFATSSVDLINYTPNEWSYKYSGLTYYYCSQLLPVSDITLTASTGEDLLLSFVELVSLNRNINIFDGGAQIVD
jgi:hypothetical protein